MSQNSTESQELSVYARIMDILGEVGFVSDHAQDMLDELIAEVENDPRNQDEEEG